MTTEEKPTAIAITAFTVWMDLDGMVHAEVGPVVPNIDVQRTATLEDISNLCTILRDSAGREITRREINTVPEPTASVVTRALKKRKG